MTVFKLPTQNVPVLTYLTWGTILEKNRNVAKMKTIFGVIRHYTMCFTVPVHNFCNYKQDTRDHNYNAAFIHLVCRPCRLSSMSSNVVHVVKCRPCRPCRPMSSM